MAEPGTHEFDIITQCIAIWVECGLPHGMTMQKTREELRRRGHDYVHRKVPRRNGNGQDFSLLLFQERSSPNPRIHKSDDGPSGRFLPITIPFPPKAQIELFEEEGVA